MDERNYRAKIYIRWLATIRSKGLITTLLRRISFILISLILFYNGNAGANENNPKVALKDLKRIVLELKYIRTPFHLASNRYRLTQDYNLSLGPVDFNEFYKYVDGFAKKPYDPRDSIVTGLFGLAPLSREEDEDFILWSADRKMLFTMLRDLRAWELVLNIFAVWSFESDSVTLECLSDSTLVTGLGYASLKNICRIDSAAYVITGETSGGDEGVHNGSVWFGCWQIPCDFRIFYRRSYRTSLCEQEQKIGYRIDKDCITAEIIKQERKVLECDEDSFRNIRFSDWDTVLVEKLYLPEAVGNIEIQHDRE